MQILWAFRYNPLRGGSGNYAYTTMFENFYREVEKVKKGRKRISILLCILHRCSGKKFFIFSMIPALPGKITAAREFACGRLLFYK
jgi:hypothetical protein